MLEDLAKVAQEYGLKIHEGKTKALCNVQKGVSLGRLRFRNEGIKILSFEEAENYLGRKVRFFRRTKSKIYSLLVRQLLPNIATNCVENTIP